MPHTHLSHLTANRIGVVILLGLLCLSGIAAQPASLFAQELENGVPSFEEDVLPILQQNCLACHNETEYEAELILETVETILDGGDSGPAVVPGNADESLLLQLAAHQTEPVMPPVDNDVGAEQLSQAALLTLRLWIDQGAQDTPPKSDAAQQSLAWRPIPDDQASVVAVELSPDGRWLAAGRGNQLRVYSVPQKRLSQTLVDSAIQTTHPGAAHLDTVHSIAWSPDQSLIATGGYQIVKIWAKQAHSHATPAVLSRTTDDGKRVIRLETKDGQSQAILMQPAPEKMLATIDASILRDERVGQVQFRWQLLQQQHNVATQDVDSATQRIEQATTDLKQAKEELTKANEALPSAIDALKTAQQGLDEKRDKTKAKRQALQEANRKLTEVKRSLQDDQANAGLQEQLTTLQATVEPLTKDFKAAEKATAKSQKNYDKLKSSRDSAKASLRRANETVERLAHILELRKVERNTARKAEAFRSLAVEQALERLELAKRESISPWTSIQLTQDQQSFVLTNNQGATGTFGCDTGQLESVNSVPFEKWTLVRTIGQRHSTEDASDIDHVESKFSDRVTALAFREDGELLAVGGGEPSRSGQIQLWDTQNWTMLHDMPDIHSDVVYDLQFAPNGGQLLSCGADRMAKLIDSRHGTLLRTFEGHTGHVLGVAWKIDGRSMATAGADAVVKVWDTQEGGQTKTISGFKSEITGVRFLGLKDRLVISTGKGNMHSRDSAGKGKPGFGRLTGYVYRITTSRDGTKIAAAGADRIVRVWTDDGKQLVEFK